MKRLILFIMVLVPSLASAQSEPPILQGARYYEFKNTIRVDSGLLLPRGDTFFLRQSLKAPGDLRWRPTDSLLYYYRGDRWLPVSAGGAIIPPLDTVTIVGNTSRRPIYVQGLYDFFTNPLTGIGLGYDSATRSGVIRVRSQLGTGGRLLVVADSMEINPLVFLNNVPTELPATPGYYLSFGANSKLIKDTLNVAAVAGLQDSLSLRPPVSSLDGRYIQNQDAGNQPANWQISGNGEAEILRARTRLEASQYWRISGSLTGLSFEDDNGNLPLFLDATSVYATGNLTATGGNYSFDMGGLATPRNYTLQNFNNANQLGTITDHFMMIDPATGRLKYLPAGTALGGYIPLTQKGAANGVATLDGAGKVPLSQINDALLGAVNYQGTYNATTNTPALPAAATANKGWYYIVSAAGTQMGNTYNIGDWAISNGSAWGKVDNNSFVASVFGRVGAVMAQNGDYTTTLVPEGTSLYFTQARARAALSAGTGIAYDNTTGVITNTGVITETDPTAVKNQFATPQAANFSITGVGIAGSGYLATGPISNPIGSGKVTFIDVPTGTSRGRLGSFDYGTSTWNGLTINEGGANVSIGTGINSAYTLAVGGSTKIGTPGVGYTAHIDGTSTYTGYTSYHKGNDVRLGFIGYSPTNMNYVAENGASHVFLGGKVGVGVDFPIDQLSVDGAARFASGTGTGAYTRISWNTAGGGASVFDNHRDLGTVGFVFRTTNDNTIYRELVRLGGANGTLQVNGSVAAPGKLLAGVTLAYTLTADDYSVVNESVAGPPTITLPDPTTCPGRIYVLIDNTVDLTSNGMNWTPAVKYKGATYTNFNNAPLSPFRTIQIQAIAGSWYIINH